MDQAFLDLLEEMADEVEGAAEKVGEKASSLVWGCRFGLEDRRDERPDGPDDADVWDLETWDAGYELGQRFKEALS